MKEENTLWCFGTTKPAMCLVVDLGLFDVQLGEGPVPLLESIKETLQDKISSPLKIIEESKVRGIRPEYSNLPTGFTVIPGGGSNVIELVS